MENIDRYGLAAQFSFEVQGNAFASIKAVQTHLGDIVRAIHQVNHAAKKSSLNQTFRSMGSGAQAGAKQASQQFRMMQNAAKSATNQLQPLKAEFRALRAESRNVDFGELHDPQRFKAATQQVHQYVSALKALETQIKGDTAADREFKAQLKSQQQIATNKVNTAAAQRQAGIASERQGKATAIAIGATATALPLIGIGKESIKVLTGFDDQMSQVKAVSGATNEELAQIRQKAKDLGATTRFSASDAASGFVLLGQAGYKTNQQLSAIDGTLNLAAAGSLELARATDITVSVLGGFQLGADQATRVADILALTANAANLNVSDLGESLKYAGPPAKAFGATLEQTAAMLGVLSNAGIRGEQGGTSLRAMFLRLAAPTGMARAEMEKLGVSIANASGEIKPIDTILSEFQASLSQLGAADQLKAIKRIFGTEATPAIQTLLSNVKELQIASRNNLQAAGAGEKAAKIMEDNIGGAFRTFRSALEGVQLEIAEVLAPTVISITQLISGLMTRFIQLPQPIKTVIIVVGTLAAGLASLTVIVAAASAAFFGLQSAIATSNMASIVMTRGVIPLTGFFQTAISAFTGSGIVAAVEGLATTVTAFATGPVGLAIAGFTALFALAQMLAPQFNVLGGVLSALAAPIGFVFGLIKGIAEGILTALKPLMNELAPVGKALLPIGKMMGYVSNAVTQAAKTFMQFAGTGEAVGKVIGQAIGALIIYPLRLVVWAVQLGINAFLQFLPTIRAVGQGIFATIRNFVLNPLALVGTVADAIARGMVTLFAGAAQLIQQAWQGFINWFANLPLVGIALNVAQGLINALNHRPTEVIPLAWQGAVERIQQMLGGLQSFGESVGNFLGSVLDPGRLFGGLIDGLITKIQGLVEAIQNSGLGKFFGNATEGLDTFISKLQQVQAPQLAIATVGPAVASPPVIAPVQTAPANKKRNETAIAALPTPPNPPAGGAAIQPLVIPVLPKLELPDIDALLAPILQQTAAEAATIAPIAIPVVPTPPTVDAIAPVIQQQNQQIQQQMQLTFATVAKEAQVNLGSAFDTVAGEWSDRWSLLERSGSTNLALLFQPGIDQLRSSLATLQGELFTFAGESAQAIATLDFNKAKVAAVNFGGDLLGIVQQAAKSFGSLGLSAVAFGVVSLASLSPLVLVLGGIVLGTLAIATNFLGIRTTLTGIAKIVQGIFQIIDGIVRAVAAIARTVYEIGRGIGQIFSGILPALTGDFSKIRQGFGTIFTAAQTGAFELQGAFNRVFGGVARVVEGAGQTVRGILQGVSQLAQGIGTAFQLGFKGAQLAIQGMVAGADLARQAIAHLIALPGKIATQWQKLQAQIQSLPLAAGLDHVKRLPSDVAAIAQQTWQRWQSFIEQFTNLPLLAPLGNLKNFPALVTGISTQIQERWHGLRQGLSNLPLIADVSQLLNLPERVQAIVGGVRERWQSLSQFLGGLPLVGDIAQLLNLPERVQAIASGVTQAWRNLVSLLGSLPLISNLTQLQTLPQEVAAISERVQGYWRGLQSFLSSLPIVGDIGQLLGLPERVQAIADGVMQRWRSLTQLISNLPISLDLGNLTNLPERIGGIVQQAAQFVQGGVEQITQLWRNLGQTLDNVPILQEFVTFARELPQLFGAVVERIQGLWTGLGDRVSGVFGRLTGRAKQTGQEMISNLAENSPGPTFVIRQKWAFTTEQIETWMTQMANKAQAVGQRIGDQVAGAAHKFGEGAHKGLGAVGNSFSSLGIVLSNFSPQLAGPLFLFSDLVDSSSMLSQSLPEAKKFFTGLLPSLSTMGATATAVFGSMGTAAVAAWTAITGPLLPFIAIAAGVALALGGLYLAFRHNFLGVRDLVQGVGSLIRGFVGLIGTALKIAIAFSPIGIAIFVVTRSFKLLGFVIRQVFQRAQAFVRGLTTLLVAPFLPLIQAVRTGFRAISRFFQGLNQIANLLLGVGDGGQAATEMLHGLSQGLLAVGRGAIAGLLIPFRIIGGVVQGVLALVRGGIALIGAVVAPVINAITQVQSAWQGFQNWFGGVMGFLPGLAEQAGQGLINALNHRPTVVIPLAWQGASTQIQSELAGMTSSAQTAGGEMANSLISDAIQNLPRTIQAIASQFGGAALQVSLFGVAALTSLTPLILVLGGIALGALAIATNFLGIRTILSGALQVMTGLFQALKATVQGLVQIFQGVGQIIKGILGALRGDFSLLQSGAFQVFGGIRTIVVGVAQGIQTSLGGALQIVRGLAEGVEQAFAVLRSIIGSIGGVLTQAIANPQQLWQGFLDLLEQIGGKVKGLMTALQSPGQLVQAVKLRVQGKAGTMADAQEMANFDQRLAKVPAPATPVVPVQAARRQTTQTDAVPVLATKAEALNQTTNAVSSLGVALSAIAPQAAAPLFAVSSLVDGALGLRDAVPALKAGLLAMFPAFAGLGSAGLTFGGIMTAVGTTISTAFGAIAGAAGVAWAAITGPLLPFIAIAAGVAVAVGAVYLAFKTNFLGIGDLIRGVVSSFQAVGQVVGSIIGTLAIFVGQALKISFALSPIGLLIKGVQFLQGVVREFIGVLFSGAFEEIASIFTTLQTEVGNIGRSFAALGEWIVAPFRAAFNVLAQLSGRFNRVGGQTNLISAAIRNTVTGILFPLRLLVGTLNLVIQAVSWLIQNAVNAFKFTGLGLAIRLLQTIASVVSEFIATLAGGAFEVVDSFFSTIGSNFAEIGNSLRELGSALSAPFKPLFALFNRLTQKTDQVGNQTNLISTGIRSTIATILLPFRLLIGAIDFVLKGINLLIQGLTRFVNGVAGVGQAIANFLLAPFQLFNNLIQGAIGLVGQVGAALASPFQMIANLFSTIQQGIGQIPVLGPLLGRLFGGTQPTTEVQRFASGGLVQGPGTSTGDRVPALVSPGEYVVNAQATRQNYGFLDAINNGLDVETALQLMPIAPPPMVTPPPVAPAQAEPKTVEVKVELNFAPGSIVIQGGGAEAAQGFVQEVTPELQRAIRDALREMVEFSK